MKRFRSNLQQQWRLTRLSNIFVDSVRIRWRPEMRRRPDMTESPSTGSGGSLPSFVLTAFLYIERSCARIIL